MPIILENAPKDPDAKIWRYFDLPKFVSFVFSQSLYFARADTFDDPQEGMLPAWVTTLFRSDGAAGAEALAKVEAVAKAARQRTYISCWTMGEEESELLWYRYASIHQGIAIQSSYASLRAALEGYSVWLGEVRYGGDEIPSEPDIAPFFLWTTKRREFEADREVRAIIADMDEKGKIRGLPSITLHTTPDEQGRYFVQTGELPPPTETTPPGVSVELPVSELVHRVVFSPRMPSWLCDALCGMMSNYELTCPAEKSALYGG